MSLKPSIETIFRKRNANLLEGRDTVLLAKHQDKFYRVTEYIGLIVKIYPKNTYGSDIPRMIIRFFNGEELLVRAYLDYNVTENSIVSIYGIIVENNGQKEFVCKGGLVRAFGKLSEAGKVDIRRIYRFGYGELSEATLSKRYSNTLTGIEELEKDKLWIYSSTNINEIESTSVDYFETEDSTIDFSQGNEFYINNCN